MSKILVAGAGPCGSAAALMLAKDGHDVTIIERDPQGPPETATEVWDSWERRGVAQFRLGHLLMARSRHILDEHLPDVTRELTSLKALEFSFLDYSKVHVPGFVSEPGDERLVSLSARRPIIELAFDRVMRQTDNLTIRRGVVVSSLLTEASPEADVPKVVGVTTDQGEEIRADIVIDSMGRMSPTPRLLEAAGARPPVEQSVDSGFVYYGQYFLSPDGADAPTDGPPLAHFDGYSILALPGDGGSRFIGVYSSSQDREMRILRKPEHLNRLISAIPAYASWIDGETIGAPAFMAGVTDRDRHFVVDGTPVAAGLLPLADAWACTNPSLGRGISIGLIHAERLRHLLSGDTSDVNQLARDWHADTQEHVAPWHDSTRTADQVRSRQLEAECRGEHVEIADDDIVSKVVRGFEAGSYTDPAVARWFAEIGSLVSPAEEILNRPGVFERLLALGESPTPPALAGPTRAEFLAD